MNAQLDNIIRALNRNLRDASPEMRYFIITKAEEHIVKIRTSLIKDGVLPPMKHNTTRQRVWKEGEDMILNQLRVAMMLSLSLAVVSVLMVAFAFTDRYMEKEWRIVLGILGVLFLILAMLAVGVVFYLAGVR